MSDDLDIRSGGVVAVDTESLRHAAVRYARVAAALWDAADDLSDQGAGLVALAGPQIGALPYLLRRSAQRLRLGGDRAEELRRRLQELAEVYEIVELRVQQTLAGDADARRSAAALLAMHESAHPALARRADEELGRSAVERALRLVSPDNGFLQGGLPALAALGLYAVQQSTLNQLGRGTIAAGRRLEGEAPPIELLPVGVPRATTAPTGLGAALNRIPGEGARIRIETYTMPDGGARYAVYLAGTRDFSLSPGGRDPWDMDSNLKLDAGVTAAAYTATTRALEHAGVPAGAELYLFGHSQGGLIADWLAIDGGYDTKLLVTAGSPTEAAVGPETLSVQLRHTDDLVPSFTTGGSPGSVGAAGSLVIERAGDPGFGLQDLSLAAHHLSGYVATARMVDAATDPRTARLRDALGELRTARSVSVIEYDALRGSEIRQGGSPDVTDEPPPGPLVPGPLVPGPLLPGPPA